MEQILYFGVALFIIDAIGIVLNGLWVSIQFGRFLEQNYPTQYHKMRFENYVKKALRVPWDNESMQYFIWFSNDDFGDPRVAIFRQKMKWSFYGFLINGIVLLIFFATLAMMLDRLAK